MADVQVEHGYTRIADELLEALCAAGLPSPHLAVVLALVRETYGYQKRERAAPVSKLAELTGVSPRAVERALSKLAEWGVTGSRFSIGQVAVRWIEKDYEQWEVPSRVRGSTPPAQRDGTLDPRPSTTGDPRPSTTGDPRPSTTVSHKRENSKETLRESRTLSARAQALGWWPEIRAHANTLGGVLRKTPGSAQLDIITARIKLDGATLEDLLHAQDGHLVRNSHQDDGGIRHLTPTTIYRVKNYDANVDQGRKAGAKGSLVDQETREAQRAHIERMNAKYNGGASGEDLDGHDGEGLDGGLDPQRGDAAGHHPDSEAGANHRTARTDERRD